MCPWTDRDKGKDSDCHLESGDSGGGRDWMHLNREAQRMAAATDCFHCLRLHSVQARLSFGGPDSSFFVWLVSFIFR